MLGTNGRSWKIKSQQNSGLLSLRNSPSVKQKAKDRKVYFPNEQPKVTIMVKEKNLNQYSKNQKIKRERKRGRIRQWHLRLLFINFPFKIIYLEVGFSDKEDKVNRVIQISEVGDESPELKRSI